MWFCCMADQWNTSEGSKINSNMCGNVAYVKGGTQNHSEKRDYFIIDVE